MPTPKETKEKSKELVNNVKTSIQKYDTFANCKSTEIESFFNIYRLALISKMGDAKQAEKIISTVVTLIASDPNIAKCTRQSIFWAVLQTADLKFDPIKSFGLCYYVPYYNYDLKVYEAQFQMGYQGWIKLAHNSSDVKKIWANVVYKQDSYEYEEGLEPKLIHRPDIENEQRYEDIIFAYACVKLENGDTNFVVVPRNKLENLRKRSPSQKKGLSGAWLTDYEEMAKAKAVKKLSKYLPKSIELQTAISLDDAIAPPNFDIKDVALLTNNNYNYPDPDAIPDNIETTEILDEPSKLTPEEMAEYEVQGETLFTGEGK